MPVACSLDCFEFCLKLFDSIWKFGFPNACKAFAVSIKFCSILGRLQLKQTLCSQRAQLRLLQQTIYSTDGFKSGRYGVENKPRSEKPKSLDTVSLSHLLIEIRLKRKKRFQKHQEWPSKHISNDLSLWTWSKIKLWIPLRIAAMKLWYAFFLASWRLKGYQERIFTLSSNRWQNLIF